jgi:hypothetical protein
MTPRAVRTLARALLGVTREPTYYLPWIARAGLECMLVLSNVEARFKVGWNQGSYPLVVVQHDADGVVAARHELTLRDVTDVVELPLAAAAGGYGIVTVGAERLYSDLYVTVSDGETYSATHGRGEWIERYPARARLAHAVLGGALAVRGRTVPAFTRHQYAYAGTDSRSHLLVLNLSNVTNRIRVTATREDARAPARVLTVPPLGARLLDVGTLVAAGATTTRVWRLQLSGNAWFNFYLIGTGPRDLAGPVSLMHVK